MNKEPTTTQMTLLTPLQPPDSSSSSTPPLALEPTNSNHDRHPPSRPSLTQTNEGIKTSFQALNEELATKVEGSVEDIGRERLKRHRREVAGRVWIPDIWGQEDMLKDWIDCPAFDACLVTSNIMSARAALAQEARRPTSACLRIENRRCRPPNS